MTTSTGPDAQRLRADHMANERTFLAWIRTAVGIMAFGFVVEKSTIFIHEVVHALGRIHPGVTPPPPSAATFLGIFLVGLGAFICLFALIRYKKVERQIDKDSYRPTRLIDVMLSLAIIAIGIFVVFYFTRQLQL